MNRKNLTAAVLAGLAGAAGIAGTAQAVNLNPDGLGQVLIYPYYTVKDGNTTILSVVNTTDSAKAVKVRFKEGYNSREVLDFNMYMSAYDVWTASLFAGTTGTPTMRTWDTTCTVPYFYGNSTDAFGQTAGTQEFLPWAYTGKNADGGPSTIARAAEGYFEIIEMGTLKDDSATAKRDGSATAATHVLKSGKAVPKNCQQLVDNWSVIAGKNGMWIADLDKNGYADKDVERNSGGLFGGAAVVNVGKGTMFSYNAKAIQGFDKDLDSASLHVEPGNDNPGLNSGDQYTAVVFFGVPQDKAVVLEYDEKRGVDAISATLMHEYTMNEFNQNTSLLASSEWIVTFPTKSFYTDTQIVGSTAAVWQPKSSDIGCGGWAPGEAYPGRSGPNPADAINTSWPGNPDDQSGWEQCTYVKVTVDTSEAREPFTSLFNGKACELFSIENWDQEESPTTPGTPGNKPPIVSPPPPGGSTPSSTPFALCYEVNRMKFGPKDVFGASDLLYTVDTGVSAGWARIDWYDETADEDEVHVDSRGLVGLPVTGYWAVQYVNGFLTVGGQNVLANYSGLFEHRGNVRRVGKSRNSD